MEEEVTIIFTIYFYDPEVFKQHHHHRKLIAFSAQFKRARVH